MKGFEPVALTWNGARYTVPASDQLRLIAEIEDALSDKDGTPAVLVLMRRHGPSHAKLAEAYGAALRYAGADVTNDEIYLSIVSALADADSRLSVYVQNAVLGLLAIVAPPVHRRIVSAEVEPEKPEGEGAEATAAE